MCIRDRLGRFYPGVAGESIDLFVQAIREHLPFISMATLQGHLLRHKDDCAGAIAGISLLGLANNRLSGAVVTPTSDSTSNGRDHRRRTLPRTLTVQQVDQMVFNPQEGWDRDIASLR